MKKWTLLVFAIILGFGMYGCDAGESTTAKKLEGETYSGLTPCADCSGIWYELRLNDDKTFKATSIYIGESNRPFIDRGAWEIQNDTLLILKKESGKDRALAIGDSTLTLLDGDQNVISGPLAEYFVLQQKPAPTDSTKKKWTELRGQGIDFRATGNEPFWGLQINYEKRMTFKMLDGDSLNVPVPAMQQDTSSHARVLKAEAESGSLTVKLYPTGCVDNMSGEVFSHGVNVIYGGETYRGCGHFINPKYKLHDFWTLHSLKGSKVPQDSLMKMPALNFNLRKNRVSGNSGCNQLTGELTLDGDSLSFDKLVSTKMACQGAMEFETEFLDALQQVESYDIAKAELLLMNQSDTLMVLRRAE